MQVGHVAGKPEEGGMTRLCLLAVLLVGACVPAEVVRSKDGTLAYRTNKGVAILKPGAEVAEQIEMESKARWLAWSPDGTCLAIACDEALVVLGSDRKPRTLVSDAGDIWFPRWSPDGKTISYVRETKNSHSLCVVPATGGAVRELARDVGVSHAWAPDGTRIATTLVQGNVEDLPALARLVLLDVATGTAAELAEVYRSFGYVEFHPGGKGLIVATPAVRLPRLSADESPPHVVFHIRLAEGELTHLSREGHSVAYATYSPSGDRLLMLAMEASVDPLAGRVVVLEGDRLVDVGTNETGMFPFWADEDHVGRLTKGRILLHDLRDGSESDVTERFAGIDLD